MHRTQHSVKSKEYEEQPKKKNPKSQTLEPKMKYVVAYLEGISHVHDEVSRGMTSSQQGCHSAILDFQSIVLLKYWQDFTKQCGNMEIQNS